MANSRLAHLRRVWAAKDSIRQVRPEVVFVNVFPNGFLPSVFCLRALAETEFGSVGQHGDVQEAESGELLTIPQEEADCFLGARTGNITTLARIEECSGEELLAECQRAVGDRDPEALRDLTQEVLALSGFLRRHAHLGVVRIMNRPGELALYAPGQSPGVPARSAA